MPDSQGGEAAEIEAVMRAIRNEPTDHPFARAEAAIAALDEFRSSGSAAQNHEGDRLLGRDVVGIDPDVESALQAFYGVSLAAWTESEREGMKRALGLRQHDVGDSARARVSGTEPDTAKLRIEDVVKFIRREERERGDWYPGTVGAICRRLMSEFSGPKEQPQEEK